MASPVGCIRSGEGIAGCLCGSIRGDLYKAIEMDEEARRLITGAGCFMDFAIRHQHEAQTDMS